MENEEECFFLKKKKSAKCRGEYMIATVCGYGQVLTRNC